jgi:hypothetical protein
MTADSLGRKPAIIGASFTAILFGGIYPFFRDPVLLSLVGFFLVVSIYILVALLFAIYIPELFPNRRPHPRRCPVQHTGTHGHDLHAFPGGVSDSNAWRQKERSSS